MGCSASKSVQPTTSNNLFCMSCIDGRATDELKGSPGGDAGNVFRACYAVTQECDIKFDQKKLCQIILACAKKFQHELYFHTDDHAVHHFDPKTATNYDDACKAENIGCGYFKLCATAPEKLDEDEKCVELASAFLKALVETIHDNPKNFDVVCLHGDHNEKYVKKSKLMKPLKADGQTFIYHPKVELEEGDKIIDVLCEIEPSIKDKKEDVQKTYKKICKSHWEHAIEVLAPGVEIEKIK
ncbi:hypothetical protein TRFO_34042 [Tritrichomonas foetus]|uniref:Uncharacterized protein n=1 Tax=Tritrichomonas foetus TaxID=1144522 RepID=A0A1J4JK20_9EUKA|nr:hypothetical protein TRFO_34042 [Tritrichomonas foetus]|eukprot:OHS99502.1 hypothetical protein TRFO_34042 [Tritrichomonas foetus]